MREFHINQFPQDRIFVLLDNIFHKELFDYLEINYTFENLNKFFDNKLNWNTFKKWKYRMKKPGRKIPQFIPLWFITEIPNLSENYYNIEKIEERIIAYKGPSNSSIIWNPNLPLREDERLMKIIAHLIGDGYVGGAFGTSLPKGRSHSEYRNYNGNLLNQFVRDIQVFGKVDTSIDYKHGHVIIPNSIGYILGHLYKVKFDTFNSRIPKRLFNLRKDLVSHFIKAFADDEAHVYESNIEFYSANKDLIIDLINLLKTKFPYFEISGLKINKKTGGKNPKYSLSILSNSLNDYADEIGFDHPEKSRDIIFNIKRDHSSKNMGEGFTKDLIMNFLNKEKFSAKQLSRKLNLRHGTILEHLNQLKDQRKVEIVGKGQKNTNLWKSN